MCAFSTVYKWYVSQQWTSVEGGRWEAEHIQFQWQFFLTQLHIFVPQSFQISVQEFLRGMNTNNPMASMFFILLVIVVFVEQSSAECCGGVNVKYLCEDNTLGVCSENICYDGTKSTGFCGKGPCNIFGCNCDDGCRTNSKGENWREAHRLFGELYDEHVVPLNWINKDGATING